MNSRLKYFAVFTGGVILILSLPFFTPSYYVDLLTQVLILSIFATATNILLGYTGLPSIGQSAFLGMAAYTIGILITHGFVNLSLNVLIGISAATVLAALFGLICVHTSGIRFLMITLALGEVIWGFAIKWRSVTRGEDGIVGIERPDTGFLWSLVGTTNFYYFVCVITIFTLLILYLIVRSPFGLSLVGIREDEERMRTLGYNVWLHKYLSYILSGIFCGIAGVLWAYYNTYVGISSVSIVFSTNGLLMPILGGANFFLGPAVGAAVMTLLENIVSSFTMHWLIILGLIYIVVIVCMPNGIVGGISSRLRKND